jgi:hypothetical protein
MVENQDPDHAVAVVEKEEETLLVEVPDLLVEKEQDLEPDPDHLNPLLNHQTDQRLHVVIPLLLQLQLVKPTPHPKAQVLENPQDDPQTTMTKAQTVIVLQAQPPPRKPHQKVTLSLLK